MLPAHPNSTDQDMHDRRPAHLQFSTVMTSQEQPRPPSPRSPSPTIIHHPSPPLFSTILPPQIGHSAVAGGHYSGTHSSLRHRRTSSASDQPARAIQSLEDVHASRQRIMSDVMQLYCCRPSLEIFERTWRHDAVFEVCIVAISKQKCAFKLPL